MRTASLLVWAAINTFAISAMTVYMRAWTSVLSTSQGFDQLPPGWGIYILGIDATHVEVVRRPFPYALRQHLNFVNSCTGAR
jgi:hypothetical protein